MRLNDVTIQRATKTKVDGGWSETWADLSTVKLHYRQLNAKEIEQNLKLGLKVDGRFYYFGCSLDVTNEDRLIMNSKTYDIVDVKNPHLLANHLEITVKYNG